MKYSPDEMPDSTTESDGVDNYGFQPESFEDTGGTDEKPPLADDKELPVEKSREEKDKEKQEEAGVDDGIYCGIGSCRPNFAQGCKNMACFSGVFSFSALVTSALNAYITSQITTLERNFNFSSSVSGILLSCNDIGYLVTTLFMSYYTRRVHVPRAMALSTILYGVSGILCAVAFFATRVHLPSPPKENDHAPNTFFIQTCQNFSTMANSTCGDATNGPKAPFGITPDTRSIAVFIIALGMILQGVAKSPRQPFVITYVDDNVPKSKTTMYIGGIIALSFLGPALAFGLGAVFSSMYITLEETSISPRDPRFIGAWWLGFIVFGAAGLVVGLPLIFFPKRMRSERKAEIIKHKKDMESGRIRRLWKDVKGLLKAVLHLAFNPVYVCLTLASAIDLMGGAGMMSFFTKYLETQFLIIPSQASLTLGVMNVLIACFGTAIGGCLTSRLKLSPMTCLKLVIGAKVIVSVLFALGFVVGCDKAVLNMGFNTSSDGNEIIISECVQGCNCDDMDYFPICGDDGNNYFSPCHAGCQSVDGMTFKDCLCMASNKTTARGGLCVSKCTNLYPYLALICIGGFIMMLTLMPGFIVSIRCVKEKDKPFAIGFSAFLGTLIGWFPGPVIFGALVDTTCLIWKTSCGTVGSCSLYDSDLLRYRLHCLMTGLRAIALVFLILALIFALCSKKTVFQPHVDDMSVTVTPKDVEDMSVTVTSKDVEDMSTTLTSKDVDDMSATVTPKDQENWSVSKKVEAEQIVHVNPESKETYI